MSNHTKELTKGIFRENPTFIIMLGMCPTLAVTTQFINDAKGIGYIFSDITEASFSQFWQRRFLP